MFCLGAPSELGLETKRPPAQLLDFSILSSSSPSDFISDQNHISKSRSKTGLWTASRMAKWSFPHRDLKGHAKATWSFFFSWFLNCSWDVLCNLWIFEHLSYGPQVPEEPNIHQGFFLTPHHHLTFFSERCPSWLAIFLDRNVFSVCQLSRPNINEKSCEALSRCVQTVHRMTLGLWNLKQPMYELFGKLRLEGSQSLRGIYYVPHEPTRD